MSRISIPAFYLIHRSYTIDPDLQGTLTMGVNIGLIMARAVVTGPVPNRPLNESEAKAIFEPIQHFQLGCLYAMLVFVSFFL